MTAVVLFLSSSLWSQETGTGQSSAPPALSAEEIETVEACIKQLGSDKLDERNASSRKLIALGPRIKPVIAERLSKLNGNDSAELRQVFDAINIIYIVMDTSQGSIELELYPGKAPQTVKNFMSYVENKFYDGTIFHRVINNFIVQGGGYTAEMKEKEARTPVKNEADNGLKNATGSLAMARTADPNSATAQFFINVADNVALDHSGQTMPGRGYCVFGKVIGGMDVVNKINAAKTGDAKATVQGQAVSFSDVPIEPVIIKSIREKK
jgi:peptidyl-prolyl cis-trans isomerase B (cyclophilin B)